MSNTIIQIKRSDATSQPANLSAGEFAYSYLSNTLFLGTTDGTGVINVGGLLYTQTIDAATAANTANTLVKRRSDGAFFGQLFGNANTATALQTGRYIGINQGDVNANSVYFDGTGNANVALVLSTMANVTAGQYGSTTAIPVITVAANGRVSNVSTVVIDTQFTVAGNTGSGSQAGGGTLTIQGGNTGIVTTVTGSGGSETVTISTDNTVVRSNTTVGGTQIINTSLTVSKDVVVQGNLNVLGSTTTINTSSFVVNDPLIFLAGNNFVSDVVDIGFVAHYNDGANVHTGLFREPNLKEYIFFKGYTPEILSNTLINVAHSSFAYSNVVGDYFKGNLIASQATVSNLSASNATIGSLILTNALPIISGGTNNTTFTTGSLTFFDGTKLASFANTGTAGTYGANSVVPVFTTDAYGRVSAVTNTAISIDTSQVTSGTLGYSRGGTGSTTYTTGALLVAGASGLTSLANTTYSQTGTLASNNTITSITVDAYGRFTNSFVSAISGLTVPQGGTGLSTITQNGITYGNGVGNLGVTAAAGGADQTWSNQLLTVTNTGTPVWTSTLDGGKF
jgi:hypothetical protein